MGPEALGLRGHTEGGGHRRSEAAVFRAFSIKGNCVAGSGVSVFLGRRVVVTRRGRT